MAENRVGSAEEPCFHIQRWLCSGRSLEASGVCGDVSLGAVVHLDMSVGGADVLAENQKLAFATFPMGQKTVGLGPYVSRVCGLQRPRVADLCLM